MSEKIEAISKNTEHAKEPEVVHHEDSSNHGFRTSVLLRTNIHFAVLCWTAILAGWNDASNGPLLPRLQQVYHVGYAVVSLIFVFSTLGFIAGSISNMLLTDKLGFGKILAIGSVCQVIAYSIQVAVVPFPVFVFAYIINGFGMAVQAAQSLSYVVRFKDNPDLRMGLLMAGVVGFCYMYSRIPGLLIMILFSASRAAYGVGALLSPLSATYFSQVPRWSFHYMACLGIALLNSVFLLTSFRLRHQEACLAEIGVTSTEKGTSNKSPFIQILALKEVHLLAAFVLCYVGTEVTIGGWIVTYIIKHRHGGPSSGYISTGFWAGLTAGRIVLLKITSAIGERRALIIYSILIIGLEFVVWLVPSLIGDAVAVACIGVFLGPMYGAAMSLAGRVLPQWLLSGSLGWIGGSGQAGSALIPSVTGAIAERAGIEALPPVLIAMTVVLLSLWIVVSRSNMG